MRRAARVNWPLVGSLIGVAFLLLSLRGVAFPDVVESLRYVKPTYALLAIVATAGFSLVKAWRWAVILAPGVPARIPLLHNAVYLGSAANLVVAHSGELLRAMLVGRRTGTAPSAILASIGIERLLDMVVVLTMVGTVLVLDRRLPRHLAVAAIVAGALVALGSLFVFALTRRADAGSLRRRLAAWLPSTLGGWLIGEIKRSRAGLGAAAEPLKLLQIYCLSLVQWCCIIAAIWLSIAAVSVPATVPAAIGVWVLMVLGLTLPSSPAQLGTTQLAFTLGLALTTAGHETAFAASVVYIFTVNLPLILVGGVLWISLDKVDLVPRGPRQPLSPPDPART